MACNTTVAPNHGSFGFGLKAFFEGIRERGRRYGIYRATLNELETMSDRELNDIGLSRHQLREVAREAAFHPGA